MQVGDVLIVDSDTHTVEEISLSTTVMRRWARVLLQRPVTPPKGDTAHPSWMLRRRSDGARLWYPNAKLAQNAVINISRSENKGERFKVSSSFAAGGAVTTSSGMLLCSLWTWSAGVLAGATRQANQLTAVTPMPQASTLHLRLHCVCVQFLVDHTTPASVLEAISKAVEHHYQQHPGEFDSKKSVLFRDCSDPLKILLTVGFTFSHCGGAASRSWLALCLLDVKCCC